MNFADIILLLVIGLLVIYSIKRVYKNSCDGTCGSCHNAKRCSSIQNFYKDYKKDKLSGKI